MQQERKSLVMRGKSGYLFLDNDTNHVVRQISGKFPLSKKQKENISRTFEDRERLAKVFDFSYLHLITSNNHCIESEFLPEYISISKDRSAIYLSESYPKLVCYPLELLRNYRDETGYVVTRRTDTHWTRTGAAVVWNHISDLLGLDSKIDIGRDREIIEYTGDLGEKLVPVQSETIEDLMVRSDMDVLFQNHVPFNGKYVHTKSKNQNKKKAIIFGGSSTGGFLDIVSHFFSELHFFWGAIFDVSLIQKIRPDVVITQVNERFFNGEFDERSYFEIVIDKILSSGLDTVKNIDFSDEIFPVSIRELCTSLASETKKDCYIGRIVGHYQIVHEGIRGCVEECRVLDGGYLYFCGWNTCSMDYINVGKRILIVGNAELDSVAFDLYKKKREDVAEFFENKKYIWSGFECWISLEYLESFTDLHVYIGYITTEKIYVKSVFQIGKDDLFQLNLRLMGFE